MEPPCPTPINPGDPSRWVGDPVDVITGVRFDVAFDFRIPWPFPFEWRRYYSTARVGELLPLGWGHTHSYDHRLRYDLDGLLYTDPSGTRHGFFLTGDGQSPSVCATGTLRRLGPHTYRVKVAGHPACEFVFTDPERPAQLEKVFLGRACHELCHDADGRWTTLVYRTEPPLRIASDGDGRILAVLWQGVLNGQDRRLWEGDYDQHGNLICVRDPYQTTQSFAYDDTHRMTRWVDRRGYGFHAAYDPAGRCISTAGEDGLQGVHLRYLPVAGTTVTTRADGGAWQHFYQEERINQIVDPYGGVTRRTFGVDGRLEREVGPMGEVLQEIVDEETGLLRPPFTPPVGMCLLLGDPWFDPVRAVALPTDPLVWEGYGATVCRNAIRLPEPNSPWLNPLPTAVLKSLRFSQGSANTARAATPQPGSPAPKKPIGAPERPGLMRHDAFGRLLSHRLPTGESCRWQYDPNGNVARYIDYAGSEWRYDYASWNLKVRETDPLGNTTHYTFNLLEKPTRIADAGGTLTHQVFDLKDRLTERHRHTHWRDQFGYDLSTGLVSVATGNGEPRVRLQMGPARRPIEIAPTAEAKRQCRYDQRGRLVGVVAADGETLALAYASVGDLAADQCNGHGIASTYVAGRRTESVLLDKYRTRYIRDAHSGETTVIDPGGGHHLIKRLTSGVFLRRHANAVTEVAQFDWNGKCLAKIRFAENEPQQAWSRVYHYSPVGALLSVADSRRGTSTYQYDAAHRLVGAVDYERRRDSFVHDAAGNLLTAPGLGGTSYSENRLSTANGRRFEYSRRHNVVRDVDAGSERHYEYDAQDRLVGCRIDGNQITFRYDALGRRTAKVAARGVTEFIWDGERLAAEIAPLGELRVYLYADEQARTPFAFIDYDRADSDPLSGQRRYVFSNQIGCPVQVEDDAGAVLWQADISAYGGGRIHPNPRVELNLRWPGHYCDPETGLHYNRHRYYSPELGRYIQVDPRDVAGGINVYAYTARPLDEVDVDGLACPKKAMVKSAEDDPQYQQAKQRADEVSENLRQALGEAQRRLEARGKDPRKVINTTLTTMVILRKDGTYEVVISGNRPRGRLPRNVKYAMDDHRYIGHGDDSPPRIYKGDKDWRYPRTKANGEGQETTHNHAEQRGLRTADCDPETEGVAYIAPTRPCCEGCSTAILTPYNEGGWGGDGSNVSDLGKKPGNHGKHW